MAHIRGGRVEFLELIKCLHYLNCTHDHRRSPPKCGAQTNPPTCVCLSLSHSLLHSVCACVCVCAIHMCWSFVALLCACVCAGAAKLISSWGIVKYINIVHFGSTSSPRCTAPQQHSIPPPWHTHTQTHREKERATLFPFVTALGRQWQPGWSGQTSGPSSVAAAAIKIDGFLWQFVGVWERIEVQNNFKRIK